MDERIKVWRAHLGVSVNAEKGYSTFCHYGYLTPCGEWVDGGSVRWPRTDDWCFSEREALAKLAPKIYAIGGRLIAQANELLAAAEVQA